MKKDKTRNFIWEKKIMLLALICGCVMSFLIPTWQTPDEYTHLKLIGESVENQQLADLISESIGIERGRVEFRYDEKVEKKEQTEAMLKKPSYEKKDVLPKGIELSIVKHFPAVIGLFLGILLGIPTYWVLQLGELFSLFFYTYVCLKALIIMPVKKEMLAFIIMLPMCLQQAGSINYDSVLLPTCFFFVAYILHLKFKKEIVGCKEILMLLFCILFITYIKLPYGILGMLIILIPLEKINIRIGKIQIDKSAIVKWRVPVVIVGFVLGMICVYILKENKWIQILFGVTVEWQRTIYLLTQSWIVWGEGLIVSAIGNFGWLDTPMLLQLVVLVYVAILGGTIVNSDIKEEYVISNFDRIIMVMVLIFLFILVSVSMIDHTIMMTLFGSEQLNKTYDIQKALYQIPYVGGLQGRYFIPLLPIAFMIIPQIKQVDRKKITCVMLIFMAILFCYVMWILLNRYWII